MRAVWLVGCLAACGRFDFDPLGGALGDAARDGDAMSNGDADGDAHLDAAITSNIQFIQTSSDGGFSGATGTVSFASQIHQENLLVVAFDFDPGPGSTITAVQVSDSVLSTYTLLGPFDSPSCREYIAYAQGAITSLDMVTVQLSAPSNSYFEIRLHEYSGLKASFQLDTSASTSGTSTAVDGAAAPTILTFADNELIFGFAVFNGQAGKPGTGFTEREVFQGDLTEDEIALAHGSYRATATMPSGTSWTIAEAAFFGQ